MKGINIWNADTFEKQTSTCNSGVEDVVKGKIKTIWVKSRPIGFFHLSHRFKCALEVFNGKADIIRFYKQ